MANTPRESGTAIYLERKNGWFWVEPRGQLSIYHGPYRDQAYAEKYRTDIDGYHDSRMAALGFHKSKRGGKR